MIVIKEREVGTVTSAKGWTIAQIRPSEGGKGTAENIGMGESNENESLFFLIRLSASGSRVIQFLC